MPFSLFEICLLSALGAIVLMLMLVWIAIVKGRSFSRRKSGKLEARLLMESSKIVWRLVNTGNRAITIVELGVRCADKQSTYRPLSSHTEEVDPIPFTIAGGEIASFRKDGERFRFKPQEVSILKNQNPNMGFFVKDAEGTVYSIESDLRFIDYLERIDRVVSTPRS